MFFVEERKSEQSLKSVLLCDFYSSAVSLLIVLLPVPLKTPFVHMRSQTHAYTVHANQYKCIVVHTTVTAAVLIQPQKQDGCVGFVALFWLYASLFFLFTLTYYLDFLCFERSRALQGL